MIAKLDYLKDLGIDAIWLSPHYPSPQFDCGYDIADYTGVEPEYGTLEDFRIFLDEAHKRDIKVILDLVLIIPPISIPGSGNPVPAAITLNATGTSGATAKKTGLRIIGARLSMNAPGPAIRRRSNGITTSSSPSSPT